MGFSKQIWKTKCPHSYLQLIRRDFCVTNLLQRCVTNTEAWEIEIHHLPLQKNTLLSHRADHLFQKDCPWTVVLCVVTTLMHFLLSCFDVAVVCQIASDRIHFVEHPNWDTSVEIRFLFHLKNLPTSKKQSGYKLEMPKNSFGLADLSLIYASSSQRRRSINQA